MDNPISFAFVMSGMLIFYAWVAWIVLEWRKLGRKSKLHQKLLDRFQAAGELQAFLQSEGGERFLKSVSIDGLAPKERIIASFSKAAVALFIGIAVMTVGVIWYEYKRIFLAAGVVIVGLGLGLFVASFVSLRFSKKWGVFNK